MPFKRLIPALIGLTALWLTGCAVSKTASSASVESRVAEEKITEARDSVVVECRDTLKEVTTVTVQLDAVGDTVKVSTVTDRTRARSRDAIAMQKTKTEVVRDTVYVERKDSVEIRSRPSAGGGQSGRTALNTTLRLVLWIIIALTGLVIVIKVFGK